MRKKKTPSPAQTSLNEFKAYQISMRDEALSLLRNKSSFLKDPCISIDYKLIRLSELVDFFILEGLPEVADELSSVGSALRVKKMLETN